MAKCVILDPGEVLPDDWLPLAKRGLVSVFNPGLVREHAGWICAYRVVGTDGLRRIGLCRLDAEFRVVPRTPAPVSDFIRAGWDEGSSPRFREWFADPRLYFLAGRLYLYWNSGWHEPRNSQFLQELDRAEFRPVGPPREMVLDDIRRPLEKNWMIFGEGPFFAVYSANPQRILRVALEGTGEILCSEAASIPWDTADFTARFGELRGGAPPRRVGRDYFSFCHSVTGTPGDYRYVASAYRFAGEFPFAPIAGPAAPLALDNPFGGRRDGPKLNPAVGEVIYPCGAEYDQEQWVVSYGINDAAAAISVISHAEVLGSLG